jgi:hypothetical protein
MAEFLPLNTPAIGSLLPENEAKGGLANIKTFEPLKIRGTTFKVRPASSRSPPCRRPRLTLADLPPVLASTIRTASGPRRCASTRLTRAR